MKTEKTLLVFKFDGILINTVELYVKKVWQVLTQLSPSLVDSIDEKKEEAVDVIIIKNWEKNAHSLATLICQEIKAIPYTASLAKELASLDRSSAGNYRLNEVFSTVKKLKNADFQIGLFTKRDKSDLDYIAKLVNLDLKLFDYLLTSDCLPGDHNQKFSSLSDWAEYMKLKVIFFGNTKEDILLNGDSIHLVIMLEGIPDSEIIEPGGLIRYLNDNFLKDREFSPATALKVD